MVRVVELVNYRSRSFEDVSWHLALDFSGFEVQVARFRVSGGVSFSMWDTNTRFRRIAVLV